MFRRLSYVLILGLVLHCLGCASGGVVRPASLQTSAQASEIYQLAETYYHNNFLPKALQHYLTVLELYPRAPEAPLSALRVGRIYFEKKSYDKAAYYFELMARDYPDHPETGEAYFYLGWAHTQQRAYDPAITALAYYTNLGGAKHLDQARVLLADNFAATEKYYEAVYQYAVGGADLPRNKQVEVLKKVRRIVEEKLAPPDLLTLLPKLPEGAITDFIRYRAAKDLLAQNRRADAARLLGEINFSHRRYKFYDKAERLIDVAAAPGPGPAPTGDAPVPDGMGVAPIPSRAKYAVGVLLPLSGSRAVFGREVLHGLMQGSELFGRGEGSFRILVRDTEADPEIAARLVDELADDPQVLAVVGPLIGDCAEAASERAELRSIPLVTLTTRENILENGQWTFRNFLTPSDQVRALIDYATNHQGALRFGILHPETPAGRRYLRLFERHLDQSRYRITAVASYARDDTDFRVSLSSLKAQGGFDALFLPDNARRVALIAPQLVYYGVRDMMVLGINSWNKDDLARKTGSYLTRSIFVDGFFAASTQNPTVAPFVSVFEDAFGHPPSFLAAIGYDTGAIIARVMSGDVITRPEARRALFAINNFPGVTGDLTVGENREFRRRLYLLRVGKDRIEEMF
jgi:ABC-type branched-subunit amino acid transport system substrate-binding protein